jgi:hypothetical protein
MHKVTCKVQRLTIELGLKVRLASPIKALDNVPPIERFKKFRRGVIATIVSEQKPI